MPVKDRIKLRRGTAAEWAAANPILEDGEQGFDKTSLKTKIGDGITYWNDLDFCPPSYHSHQAGLDDDPLVTDGTGGNLGKVMVGDVAGNVVWFYTNTEMDELALHTIAQSGYMTLTDDQANYICADRDTNSWTIMSSIDSIDYLRYIPYVMIYKRSGSNSMHKQNVGIHAHGEVESHHKRVWKTQHFQREVGALENPTVADTTLALTLSGGGIWSVDHRYNMAAVTTATRQFECINTISGWQYFSHTSPVLNNAVYNDTAIAQLSNGSSFTVGHVYRIDARTTLDFTTCGASNNTVGTLFKATVASTLGAGDLVTTGHKAITAGKWAIMYIWRGVEDEDHLYTILSTQEYDSKEIAQASKTLGALPPLATSHAIFIGRVIFQQGQTTSIACESAFDTVFQASGVITDHGSLSGLTDDDHLQYFNIERGDARYVAASSLSNYQLTASMSNYLTSQTVQTQGTFALNGTSGNVTLSGGNNITLSTSAGSIVVHGKTDFPYVNTSQYSLLQQTSLMSNYQSAGAYLTTAAQSGHSHSVVVQGNISATQGSGAYTLSVPAQTVQTQGTFALNGTSGNMTIAAGSNVTLSTSAGSIVVHGKTDFPYVNALEYANLQQTSLMSNYQPAGAYLTTAAQVSHSHGNPTLALTGLNGTTASGSNGLTLSLSANAGGGGVALSVGTNSFSTGTIQFANSNGVTFGMDTNGVVTATVVPGSAAGIAALAAGGATNTSGTVVFGNSNNISFLTTNGSIVASYADPDAWSILGNTLGASNTLALTNGTLFLAGGNNITLSQNGSTLTIQGESCVERMIIANTSGGTTGTIANSTDVYLYGGANVTLSMSNNSVTVNAAAGGAAALTYLSYQNRQLGASASMQLTNNQIWMLPFRVAGGQISASTIQYLQSISGTFTSAVAATHAETMKWCIYSSNATDITRMDSMSSGSFTWQMWNNGTSSASWAYNGLTSSSAGTQVLTQAAGIRMMNIPYGNLIDSGLYVMAFAQSSSSAGYSGLVSRYGMVIDSPMPIAMGFGFGSATATSNGYVDGGSFSVTSNAFPSSIGFSQIRQHSNFVPYFKIGAI